jgi:L-gulonate 3-dehydrogenase
VRAGAGPVALVGAGTIGSSWAIVFGRAGVVTRVYDASPAQLEAARSGLGAKLRLLETVGVVESAAERQEIATRIEWPGNLDSALSGAVYVQESVPEELGAKRAAIEEIASRTSPTTVIGSSASAIPMTEIARGARHPERCVVVHPTNPPHIVPLVEIVPGELTSGETVKFAYELMRDVGQAPIVLRREIFGFVLNRLQFALEREAFSLARQGIASVADIDRCVSEGLGLRWALFGPYGVEATNAAGIEDDLRKFQAGIRQMMAEVCQPFDGPDERDIELAIEGVEQLQAGRSHDELTAFRDELVLKIRLLKEEHWRGQA